MVETKAVPQADNDLYKLIKTLEPTAPEAPVQNKLLVALEVKLFDKDGNAVIKADKAVSLLESDYAKKLAISKAQERFHRRAGYSDQSRIMRYKNGEPAKDTKDADSVRIVYTILGEL
jgi:hypothetical protein